MKWLPKNGLAQNFIRIAVIATFVFYSVSPSFAEEQKKEEKSHFGLVLGLGMIAAGTIFSVVQYNASKERYEIYRKSAFTDNTTGLRKDVERHDLLCIIGGAVAGVGAIGVVVSF